jgi:hypothetical protein
MVGEVVGAVGQDRGVGWGDGSLGQGLAGLGEGPRYSARAVRTKLAAVLGLMRSRERSQPAVEAAGRPWSAPAAPRASRSASSASHWPSRRSTSPRSPWTRSAWAASARRSGSWSARRWRSAASAASPVGVLAGWLVEWVFESMAGTYQPLTPRQAPTRNWGQLLLPSRLVEGLPAGSRATPVPGKCMGPDGPDPPCQLPAPDPIAPGPPTHPATQPHGADAPRAHPTAPPNRTGPDGPRGGPPDPRPRRLQQAGLGDHGDPGQRAARTSTLPSVTRAW